MEKNVGKIKATSAKSRKSRNQRKTTHKEYGNGLLYSPKISLNQLYHRN